MIGLTVSHELATELIAIGPKEKFLINTEVNGTGDLLPVPRKILEVDVAGGLLIVQQI